jgi:hypothetical protein
VKQNEDTEQAQFIVLVQVSIKRSAIVVCLERKGKPSSLESSKSIKETRLWLLYFLLQHQTMVTPW